ncbi:amino acid ABC transporter permease [Microvirga sp. W0021]|uniref:Amino acid ABC transporter permease n=1 Tax=Hohaiivirga grylli TaxID=3133970 RepID=A0ABV0BKK5_9HYPH
MNLSVIWDNLDYLLIGAWPNGPVGGLALTVILSISSAIASAVLGLILGIAMVMASQRFEALLATALGFFRAIPIIMLIFWIYFLLPVLFGITAPQVGTVVIALSLVGGAYLGHGVAAGIRSVSSKQWDAGLALGLKRWEVLRLIILPQALPRMMPSFINQWISLIKDTSLAYVIGVPELSFVATQVNNRAMVYPIEVFLFIGLVYFILCTACDMLANRTTKWAGLIVR